MAEVIADCSAIMALVLPDEKAGLTPAEERMLIESDLIAPFVWPLEIANVLRKCVVRKRISAMQAQEVASEIEKLGVKVADNGAGFGRWLDLALAHDLSSYDSTYIDLALMTRKPLATFDRHLAGVARKLGLRVLVPAA